MGDPTKLEMLKDLITWPYRKLKYRLAISWLNDNFGYQEYWGDRIMGLLALETNLLEPQKEQGTF